MANTYSWDCKTVDTYPTQDTFSDVVYNVHWRLTGTDDTGEHSATVIGTQTISVETIDAETFVAFESLTHDDVVGWVETEMGEERVAELKSSVDSQIADKLAPKSVTKTIGSVGEFMPSSEEA
jgi:hypothetical protein